MPFVAIAGILAAPEEGDCLAPSAPRGYALGRRGRSPRARRGAARFAPHQASGQAIGTSGEVVEASLASDDATFFVGQIVSANGGVVTF
jgi:hypothetical protein